MNERAHDNETLSAGSGPPAPAAPSATAARSASPTLPRALACDRFCRACGANLVGCAVEREEKYRLLIARCPHCGAVNPVQPYPRAGAWAERWAMLLAGLWLVFLIALAIATDIAIVAGAFSVAIEAVWPVSEAIDAEFLAWSTQRAGGDTNAVYANYWEEYDAFIRQIGRANIVSRIGGLWRHVDFRTLAIAVIPLLGAFIMGTFWGLTLLGASRRARIIACAIHFLAVGLVAMFMTWMIDSFSVRMEVHTLISTRVTIPLTSGLLLLMLGSMIAGTLAGRPLARLIVATLLPPRLTAALAILWEVDGKCPPAMRPRSAPSNRSGSP